MKFATIVVVGVTATAAVLAASATACSNNNPASSTAASSGSASSSAATSTAAASSSTAAASADYSALLIKASDITAPGDIFTAQPPTLNPNGKDGVATVFANQNDTREIGDTILVLPDVSAANTARWIDRGARKRRHRRNASVGAGRLQRHRGVGHVAGWSQICDALAVHRGESIRDARIRRRTK
jgi:hypothetical protein